MDSEQKKKILIVEDEPALRNVLIDKFSNEGFEVIQARDGEEALKTALAEHPDLILLDILLPVMDGMTMLTHLREDVWGKDVHVMLLSNLNTIGTVAKAVELGSYEYLVKSDWKLEDIVHKVRSVLGMA